MSSSTVQVFRTSSFNTHRRAPWVLLYGAISLTVTMLIIVFLVFLFGKMLPVNRRSEKSSSTFCCPHILERVYEDVDFRRDPCENVLDYACAGRALPAIHRGGTVQSSTVASLGDPITGNPVTAAGKAIAAYYKVCFEHSHAKEPGYLVARAVLDVAAAKAFMPADCLVRLLFELSLKYDLPSLLNIRVETAGSGISAYLSITFASLATISQIPTPAIFQAVKVGALSTINEELSTSVPLEAADVFFNALERANTYQAETSTLQDLQGAIPSITPARWKNITDRFVPSNKIYTIVGVPLHILRKHISEWMEYDAEPNSVTLALLGASIHLVSRITVTGHNDEQRTKAFCESAAKELRPLWVLRAAGRSHPQELNSAIEGVYWHVLRRVLRIVSFTMVKSDRDHLTRKLVRMHLLFPSDVAPTEQPVPKLTEHFARAYLSARAYMFEVRRHQASIVGITRDFMGELNSATIRSTAETLAIPSGIYASVVAMNTTEELLLMPTIGVRIANAIWEAVLTGNWSRGTKTLLRIYIDCIKDKVKAISSTHAALSISQWLSLETVVEATREDDWHARVDGSRNLTFSQLFYAMYVQHHYCSGLPSQDSENFVKEANALISSFPDFVSSFKCGKYLHNEVPECLQHLFRQKR
ncbi:hypothetical protein HPB49_022419 [Dermacentor silvarum]|uniref:Uncharacterized protein n=1 Tax=Dermacentor silvarum TaxID=543639 RepID=A0ACB8CBS3_DERSI|nr:hypothetical protein HPB49_022419 [Dermacentor silvarum]